MLSIPFISINRIILHIILGKKDVTLKGEGMGVGAEGGVDQREKRYREKLSKKSWLLTMFANL